MGPAPSPESITLPSVSSVPLRRVLDRSAKWNERYQVDQMILNRQRRADRLLGAFHSGDLAWSDLKTLMQDLEALQSIQPSKDPLPSGNIPSAAASLATSDNPLPSPTRCQHVKQRGKNKGKICGRLNNPCKEHGKHPMISPQRLRSRHRSKLSDHSDQYSELHLDIRQGEARRSSVWCPGIPVLSET